MTMICNQGRAYYPQGENKKRQEDLNKSSHVSHHSASYMRNAKKDRAVNKEKGRRTVDEAKHAPRRSLSDKPDRSCGAELCPFQIKLQLKEGEYW